MSLLNKYWIQGEPIPITGQNVSTGDATYWIQGSPVKPLINSVYVPPVGGEAKPKAMRVVMQTAERVVGEQLYYYTIRRRLTPVIVIVSEIRPFLFTVT